MIGMLGWGWKKVLKCRSLTRAGRGSHFLGCVVQQCVWSGVVFLKWGGFHCWLRWGLVGLCLPLDLWQEVRLLVLPSWELLFLYIEGAKGDCRVIQYLGHGGEQEAISQGQCREFVQSGVLGIVPVAVGGLHQGLVLETVPAEGVQGTVLVAAGC